jgi:Protein of unknown function (DUF3617)
MKKLTLAILLTLSGAAFAQSSSLKPGLWEIKPISQIMDGRDMTAQMASAQAKMQQEMANMPPEQRKQMETMMGPQGASAGSSMRICVSPAMAARDKPMVDPEGRCEPATVNRSGNKTSFEFNCTANGRTSVGKGESTVSGDTVTTRVDMTMTDARGRHTIKSESQMKYLGSDCQGIKPLDQLVKKFQNSPQ